ncbi:MAG: hypothetical protein ACLRQF_04410 [Thomasclavelia ramosa]
MIIAEFEKYDLTAFKEVVFCGFGEPLTRHDDLMKVAKYIKRKGQIYRLESIQMAYHQLR